MRSLTVIAAEINEAMDKGDDINEMALEFTPEEWDEIAKACQAYKPQEPADVSPSDPTG